MPDTSAPPRRLIELDALRGLAAVAVLLFHYTTQFDQTYGHTEPNPVSLELGRFGVQLFFVISGFVIFMTLERTRRPLDFVVSRFTRLFPAYWACLGLTLLALSWAGLPEQHVTPRDVLFNLTMLVDLFDAHEVDGSYWTLQIELLFYLQMLFWFAIGALSRIRLVVAGWIVLSIAYGLAARLDHPLSYIARELLIVRFAPFFGAGILMFRVWGRRDPLWQNVAMLAACALAAGVVWTTREGLVLLVCVAIFSAFVAGWLRFLARAPFVFLGFISYPLYLLHQEIGYITIEHFERLGFRPGDSIVIAIAVVLPLAAILSYLVERPSMRWLRGVYRTWTTPAAAVTPRGSR